MACMKSSWLMPCLPYLRLSAAVSSECKESARRSLGCQDDRPPIHCSGRSRGAVLDHCSSPTPQHLIVDHGDHATVLVTMSAPKLYRGRVLHSLSPGVVGTTPR